MEAVWMGNVVNLFKGAAMTRPQPTAALQGAETALPGLQIVKKRLKIGFLCGLSQFLHNCN